MGSPAQSSACYRDAFASWGRPNIPGGAYAKAYAKLQAKGLQLHWQSAPAGQQAKAKKASKTKFTCPDCGQNAWAKPDALLGCYACYEETEELVLMLAEPSDEDTK
jgi:predicted RNA-binding Zn-ribbon protein involved in translation (DUF1610 family)